MGVQEQLVVDIPDQFLAFISKVIDIKVTFNNDKDNNSYRTIKFVALGKKYVLITSRFDLTTYQVIMLYASGGKLNSFSVHKRTLKGIHLLANDPNGIQVQFYLYMIAHLLLLAFKQERERTSDEHKLLSDCEITNAIGNIQIGSRNDIKTNTGRTYVKGLVSDEKQIV